MCHVSGSIFAFIHQRTKATLIYRALIYQNHSNGVLILLVSPHRIARCLLLKCLELETAVEQSCNCIARFEQRKSLMPFETLNEFSFR